MEGAPVMKRVERARMESGGGELTRFTPTDPPIHPISISNQQAPNDLFAFVSLAKFKVSFFFFFFF